MARMMRDGHLGFAHLREIDPPKTPRISGRYLDRWVGVWENACNVPDAFQRMSRVATLHAKSAAGTGTDIKLMDVAQPDADAWFAWLHPHGNRAL